jgi:hypothetical protein
MYIFIIICLAAFTLYYLNFNPFIRKPEFIKNQEVEVEVDTNDIEISINELKNLNQYIDNGITNHPAI